MVQNATQIWYQFETINGANEMKNWKCEKYETYMRLRNDLDLAMSSVSGSEFKLLAFLMSRSLGEGKTTIKLSLSEFYGENIQTVGKTGLSKSSVIRCIASLTKRGLIFRTEGPSKIKHTYSVNSDAITGLIAQ
jgi:DNA-binding MarR family transcriptional regulator